ncbi:MAG: 4'-phosphopantetheinyl transferase superfamily protein [Oscillatoria sp. PMC 1076.18]|nr:4'-phosphopantetheinyl transferase superfamily protein [Oscillatoria sp. PMC 1076.18]
MWRFPPANLQISSPEVHLWRANLDLPTSEVTKLAANLSEDELARANRFYFERDRRRFIIGRGRLREILAGYLQQQPAELEFVYSDRGKPSLKDSGSYRQIEFNLSHSHELVVYAVSCDRAVGIDIEYLRSLPDAEKLAQRFFSPQETAIINSLPPEKRQLAFFCGWTSKEAYLKATGAGIAKLADVEVSVSPTLPAQLLTVNGSSCFGDRWSLQRFTPAPNYIATVAVPGNTQKLNYFQLFSETTH